MGGPFSFRVCRYGKRLRRKIGPVKDVEIGTRVWVASHSDRTNGFNGSANPFSNDPDRLDYFVFSAPKRQPEELPVLWRVVFLPLSGHAGSSIARESPHRVHHCPPKFASMFSVKFPYGFADAGN